MVPQRVRVAVKGRFPAAPSPNQVSGDFCGEMVLLALPRPLRLLRPPRPRLLRCMELCIIFVADEFFVTDAAILLVDLIGSV